MEQQGSWDERLSLVKFTYNNSFHASIKMVAFEALYGRKCITPLCWYETEEALLLAPDVLQRHTEEVTMIKEKMKVSQSRQKSYYD